LLRGTDNMRKGSFSLSRTPWRWPSIPHTQLKTLGIVVYLWKSKLQSLLKCKERSW
jgi:hypothetical protein